MNEINNNVLYSVLRHRADAELAFLREAMQRNDKLNARFQSLNAELDRICDMVQPVEREAGGNRRPEHPHSIRETAGRLKTHMRDPDGDREEMEDEIRATSPCNKPEYWKKCCRDLSGPRPRTPCPFPEGYS